MICLQAEPGPLPELREELPPQEQGQVQLLSDIPAGTYTFIVTSAGRMPLPRINPVVINTQPPSPEVPAVSVDCSPGNTSVSVVSPTGSGLQYRLDDGNYQSGTLFNNVSAGSHTVTVRNSFGCETTGPVFQVSAAPSAPLIGTITQPSCSVNTGSVVLNGLPSGSWTITRLPGGATTTGTGSSSTISSLSSGTYSFTVTNSAGCTSGTSASVTINPPVSSTHTTCCRNHYTATCALTTGSVVLTGLPSSGTWILIRIPGDISSTGSGTGTTVSGLTSGTYSFRVTNSVGCTSSSSGNVVINAQASPPDCTCCRCYYCTHLQFTNRKCGAQRIAFIRFVDIDEKPRKCLNIRYRNQYHSYGYHQRNLHVYRDKLRRMYFSFIGQCCYTCITCNPFRTIDRSYNSTPFRISDRQCDR